MTVGGRLHRPGTEAALGNLSARVKGLERQTHGHLIYVGTYPGDPRTTPESPPFQNSWANIGGDYPPLAFLMGVDGFVRVEGTCDGGIDGTVVFTFPEGYRPERSVRFLGALTSGSDFLTWQVDPNGDAIIVARGYRAPDGSITVEKLSPAGGDDGDVIMIVGGIPAWADPPSTAITFYEAGVLVAAETGLNLVGTGVVSVDVDDNAPASRVDASFGVAGGTDGQVVMSESGVGVWHDLPAPTPALVFEHNEAGPVTRGKLDFVDSALIDFVVVDDSGDNEVDVSLAVNPGANGQVIETVGGVAGWHTLKRRFISEWFGSLPTATGPSVVLKVPYDDGASVNFNLTRLVLRVEVTGLTATSVTVEKSNPGGAFVPVSIGSASVAAGVNEDDETAGLGGVSSGDLIRVNFTALGTGANNYLVQVEGDEP